MSEESHHRRWTHLHRRWEDLRIWRLCVGLCLGPIVLSAVICVIAITDAETKTGDALEVTFWTLIVSIVWSQICGWIYLLAIARRRRRIARIECLMLGIIHAILALLLILVLLVTLGGEDEGSFSKSFELRRSETVITVVSTAAFLSLTGLLAGWLFWRFAVRVAPTEASIPSTTVVSLHRRWVDLRIWQLICALIAAACLPTILVGITSALFFVPLSDERFNLPATSSALLIAVMWFVLLGLLYLFAVSRRRGLIRRQECFLLGVLIFCLFPIFLVVLQQSVGVGSLWIGANAAFEEAAVGAVATAVLFAPLGLLSGWIFWRIGVRPARPNDLVDAPVFD